MLAGGASSNNSLESIQSVVDVEAPAPVDFGTTTASVDSVTASSDQGNISINHSHKQTIVCDGGQQNLPDTNNKVESNTEHTTPISMSLHTAQSNSGQAISVTYVATKNPKDTLKAVYKAGIYKAGLSMDLLCIQSFMAGIYVSGL